MPRTSFHDLWDGYLDTHPEHSRDDGEVSGRMRALPSYELTPQMKRAARGTGHQRRNAEADVI